MCFGKGSPSHLVLKALLLLGADGRDQLGLTADCLQLLQRDNCGVVGLQAGRVQTALAYLAAAEHRAAVEGALAVDAVVVLLIDFNLSNLLHRLRAHVDHRLHTGKRKCGAVANSKIAYHWG